jgi:hypothetical protein
MLTMQGRPATRTLTAAPRVERAPVRGTRARDGRTWLGLAALAAAALAALALAAVAPQARASAMDVIRDCSEDGSLDGKYSQDELSGALDQLPSDIDEYTDCRSVIRAAQLAGAGGKSGGGRAKGAINKVDAAAAPSSREQRRLADAGRRGPVDIGGRVVEPGASGAPLATAGLGTDLPTMVLLVLALLAIAMAAGAAYASQRRWPAAWQSAGAALTRFREGVRRGISRRR